MVGMSICSMLSRSATPQGKVTCGNHLPHFLHFIMSIPGCNFSVFTFIIVSVNSQLILTTLTKMCYVFTIPQSTVFWQSRSKPVPTLKTNVKIFYILSN